MLMLLSNHKFIQFEWAETLKHVIICCNEVLRQHKHEINFRDMLLHCLPRQQNLQIIHNLQSSITISILGGFHDNRVIEYTVRTLDIFNVANDARPLKERINFKEFHNDAINKEVSLKDHFIAWIREREQCK